MKYYLLRPLDVRINYPFRDKSRRGQHLYQFSAWENGAEESCLLLSCLFCIRFQCFAIQNLISRMFCLMKTGRTSQATCAMYKELFVLRQQISINHVRRATTRMNIRQDGFEFISGSFEMKLKQLGSKWLNRSWKNLY